MDDAKHLCSIAENKKMLEQVKLILNLRKEEDRMVGTCCNGTNSLQEETTTTGCNDNSVTVVVDEDILNQAKEIFRFLKEEENMKMDKLNANACSMDENKGNSKTVEHTMQFNKQSLKLNEKSSTLFVENAMIKITKNQNLLKQDTVPNEKSTAITPETLSQEDNGNESETWKRRKTPHEEYHNSPTVRRRRKVRNIEYKKPSKFSAEGFPLNWTNLDKLVHSSRKEAGSGENSIRVAIEPGKEEYDAIWDDFNSSNVCFTQLERFQSTRNLQEFKFEMDYCRQIRGSGFNFGTMYLYHCTTEELEKVCNKGLKVTDRGPFGSGIYFSDNPGVCLRQIRRQTSSRVAYVLKCRVIMGDVKYYGEGEYDETLRREPRKENRDSSQWQYYDSAMYYGEGEYDETLRREPRKENRDSSQWQYYDSAMGSTEDGLEVVVYEERRILIEYIIHLNAAFVDKMSDESEC